MSRALGLCLALAASPVAAQQVNSAGGGVLRVLDKVSGTVRDLEMTSGETQGAGLLEVTLEECRYPAGNPSGDAFALLTISYQDEQVFRGWMIASAPALNALDHPRYDVWVMRCMTS
ncbi:DUF2155 domain-containing protein [Pelagovum pacificum]|uniref:DUF2155 domain-containing protein n=1 Tax=Pelagovum pacificum TaxID=2588711 RepID=A0A5C5GF89_9RHOB|nr:DUF2155 domain-containing protein [Pelagovum pacificum]QQA44047.1 DUF2155 domain-containing protein [Pelagovum pacificum]TNY32824.1 DUF2155 domain-containing protein [Pelagovum pacificum]